MKIVWLAPYPLNKLKDNISVKKEISGHAAPWLVNLSTELEKYEDIELSIITNSPAISESQSFQQGQINFHILKYSIPFTERGYPSYFRFDKLIWYSKLVRDSISLIEKIQPDLVHAHGTENAFALIAINSRLPHIISIQGIIHEVYKREKNLNNLFQLPIEKYTLKSGLNFGCRTDWDKTKVRTFNKNSVIHYMPEAVSPIFLESIWKNPRSKSILFVGSLFERKGIETMFRSFALCLVKFPELKLKLIGRGSRKYENKLHQSADSLGISRTITWLGYLDSEEIAKHITTSTIFVLPTLVDNSPNTLIEAMAAGIPCIASNVGGISSIIHDQVNGVLFKSKDVYELSNAIIKLLKSKKLQNFLSNNAKNTITHRNSPKVVAKQTIDIYKKILNR